MRLVDIGIVCFTAAALVSGFPPFDAWPLTWTALVPFLWRLPRLLPAQAVRFSFLTGMLVYGVLFHWFVNMSHTAGIPAWLAWVAAAGMGGYASLYFVVFAIGARWIQRQKRGVWSAAAVACLWVVLEWIRGHAFSGFGWAALSQSQTRFLPVIQLAEFTGEYGVSFLIVLFNAAAAQSLGRPSAAGTSGPRVRPALAALAVVMAACVWGAWRWMSWRTRSLPQMRVGVVQPNIPQGMKWDERFFDHILRRQIELTERVLPARPALMIWPETSFPDIWQKQPDRADRLSRWVARARIPLLFGSITKDDDGRFHNTALLLDEDGRLAQFHHKRHLVPFGEYLPGRNHLGWLADVLRLEDFTPGRRWRMFTVLDPAGGRRVRFGVLICFEDTVGRLSRDLVRQGAHFLVNITNDGWFGDSPAPLLHYRAAVYRSVENRRSLVRAANTGVSVFIDPTGERTGGVRGRDGRVVAVAGTAAGDVRLNDTITFYTKYGDVFTAACLMCILVFVGREAGGGLYRRRRGGLSASHDMHHRNEEG